MKHRPAATSIAALAIMVGGCSEPANVDVAAPLDRGPDALPDGITVSGEGEVEGAPDTLTVDLGVSIKRDTVGAAVNDAGAVATAVLDAVRAQGVEEQDVQTRSYTVNPEFRFVEDAAPIPDGYRVSNSVTVRVRDLPNAGTVIDAAIAAGGDDLTVNGVAFSLEEDGPALRAAREKAFLDARAKAEQFAMLAGRPLGAAQAVSDVVITPVAQQFTGEAARTFALDVAAGPPIQAGEVTTRVTVNTRFTFG